MQLIETLLKPYYKTVSNPDDMLIEILSPTILNLFTSKKEQLQEVSNKAYISNLFNIQSCFLCIHVLIQILIFQIQRKL